MMHAVLTGDIVGSSGLSPSELRRVVGVVKSIPEVFPDAVVGSVDSYGGDSWQMLLSDCGVSLRIALFLRASLKRMPGIPVDSRISIAWGDVDMELVNRERMSESTGALFTLSGRALEGLKKNTLMCFSALGNDLLTMAVGGSIVLVDLLVRQWSGEQARAVAETILGKTQAEIAAEYGIGQSSVNKSLQAAHWGEIASSLGFIDGVLAIMGKDNHPKG